MLAEKLQLWKQDKKGSKKEGKRRKLKKNKKVFISSQLLVSKKHLCFLFSPRWERAQNDASDSNQGLGFQTLSSLHLSMREGWRGDVHHISALHILSRLRNIPRSQMTTSAFSLVINTMQSQADWPCDLRPPAHQRVEETLHPEVLVQPEQRYSRIFPGWLSDRSSLCSGKSEWK